MMSPTRRVTPPGGRRALVLLGSLALVAAACGHRTGTDELVAANSQVQEGGPAAATGAGGNGATATGAVTGGATLPGATGAGSGSGAAGSTPASTDPSGVGAQPGSGGAPGAAAAGTPGETGPIVLGSVGNYSGIAGPPQAPQARAVQVWAEYINTNGGLFGRQVQVIVVDDRGDPAQHVAALRDLVENRGVVAFVNNASGLTSGSGVPYLESVGVPVIGTGCNATVEYTSTMLFPQCSHPMDFFELYLRAAVENGGTQNRLAVIACNEVQVCSDAVRAFVTDGGAERAGATVVYQARVSLAQPDFTSECRAAQAAGADMVAVVLDPTGVIRLAQSCARQGFNPLYVLANAMVFYESKDQPGLAHTTVGSQTFNFVGAETPARQEFQDVMATYYGSVPGPAEAYGWASAKLFERVATIAAQNAQSITPQTLVDALHTLSGETLGGLTVSLTFPAGGAPQPAACSFAVEGRDGEWTPLNGGNALCN